MQMKAGRQSSFTFQGIIETVTIINCLQFISPDFQATRSAIA